MERANGVELAGHGLDIISGSSTAHASPGATFISRMKEVLRVVSDDEVRAADGEAAPAAEAPADEAPAEEAGIDLGAWVLRRRRYPFPKVVETIKRKFALVVTSPEQAIAFLADQGFPTPHKADGDPDR